MVCRLINIAAPTSDELLSKFILSGRWKQMINEGNKHNDSYVSIVNIAIRALIDLN